MPGPLRVLVVEDSPDDAELMILELARGGFEPTWGRVETADQLRAALSEGPWDVVLSDHTLPGFGAAAALALCREADPDLPFVVVSGTIGEEAAVELMRAGASDWLLKDKLARLAPAVEREVRDAADRRTAGRAIGRLAAIVRSSEDAISGETLDGIITDWNPAAERLFGWTAGEVIGRPVSLLVPPDRVEESRETPDRIRRGERIEPFETVRLHKDGTRIDVSVSVSPIRDGEGRLVGAARIARDIRDRRQAETLRRSAEHYRALADSVPGGVYTVTADGRCEYVNQWWCDYTGMSPEECLGTGWVEALHPDDRVSGLARWREDMRAGRPLEAEYRFRRADGTYRWFLDRAVPFKDDRGQVIRWFGTCSDIEDMRRGQEALARDALLLASVRDSVAVTDLEGIVTYWNEGATRIFGWTAEEMLGRPMSDRVPPEGRVPMTAAIEAIGRGEDFSGEWEDYRKDGSRVWIDARTAVFRDRAGRPAGILGVAHDVTARKVAEAALRASEARFKALVEKSYDAFVLLAADGTVLYASPACERIGGRPVAEFVGRNMSDWIHPDDLPDLSRRWADLLGRPGGVSFGLRRFRRDDGTWRYAEATYTNLLADPDVRAVAVNFRDVTERVEAEAERGRLTEQLRTRLRQQEAVARLGQLAVANPDVSAVLDHAAGAVAETLGNEFCKILELRADGDSLLRAGVGWREGVVGRAVVSLDGHAGYTLRSDTPVVVEDLRTETRFAAAPLLREHGIVSGMSVVIKGRERPYGVIGTHSTRRRSFDANDVNFLQTVAAILASAVERNRLQDDLVHEAHLTTTMMEALPGVVFLFDQQYRPVQWNRAAEQVTGFSAAEIAGMSALDFISPDDRDAAEELVREVFRTGSRAIAARLQTKDGQRVSYFFSGARLATERGTYLLAVGLDVSERVRLEEQLRQSQKMDAFGQLAGGVAHDFNNLLTVINGYTEVLLGKLSGADPSRGFVDEIRRAGERSAALTRQLLAFSRKQVVAPRVLDLNVLLTDLGKLLRRVIGEDVRLVTSLEPRLGSLRADPGQLEQVVLNLAVNARDAMPGGGTLTIQTSNVEADCPCERGGRCVLLTVSDTGCGMTDLVRARAFEPFFTTKELGKGTGLGLAVVHGIVEQAGGRIEIDSAVGSGTTFRVYFPRVEQPAGPVGSAHRLSAGPRGTETVLLVEDESAVRALSSHILRGCGYAVLEAGNGDEALRVARAHPGPIHLLVTDVVMPGLGGRLLAERLAPLHPETAVLYVSGYTDDAVVRHGVTSEQVHFLQKPFSPLVLAHKIRAMLDAPRPGGDDHARHSE